MTTDVQRAVSRLADQLTDGFIALSEEYRLLREQHRQLEDRLTWVKKQHQDLLLRFTPATADDEYSAFLDELDEAGRGTINSHSDWLEMLSDDPDGRSGRAFLIRQAELANEKLKALAETKVGEVRIWNGPSADGTQEAETIHLISPPPNAETLSQLEKDFTVAGTPSNLGCPFAQHGHPHSTSGKHSVGTPRSSVSKINAHGRRSKRSSFNDPIRAELHCEHAVSADPSVEGSGPVCPIRFLDQHSPEEVAKYFENHKHEIPRSHEVCIKRFQSNAEQIRQLDAKYGNLVSMIQGLGQKHQPWLPDKPAEDEEAIERDEASDKVKNWAEGVSASLKDGETDNPAGEINAVPAEDNGREAHFDRPLKEVRVGESPSRPWGITVPAKYNKSASIASPHSPATASPLEGPHLSGRPAACPFDHSKLQAQVSDMPDFSTSKPDHPLPHKSLSSTPQIEPQSKPSFRDPPKSPFPSPTPQMVFTGPVFIGYSPDMIQQFLGQGTGKTA